MKMKQFIYFVAALLTLGSCSEDQSGNSLPANGETVTVSLSLQPSDMHQVDLSGGSSAAAKLTRSVTALADAQEKVINNLWVFEYVDGTYVRGEYLSSVDATKLSLDLSKAASANIYFVANVGEAAYKGQTLATEAAFWNYSLRITNEASITPSTGYLPMFGEAIGVPIPDHFKSGATVTLSYIVARVDFSYTVTSNMPAGFLLKQARLIGVPRYMHPYISALNRDEDNSNDIHFPADTLTTQMFDKQAIDEGNATAGTLTFYLPDNWRGVGSNTSTTDPKLKAGIDNATAIQLIGDRDGDEITYNFYLGSDEFNDYNLKRNVKYTLAANLDGISTNDLRVRVQSNISKSSNAYILKPGASVFIPIKRANQSDLGEQLADVNTGWSPGVLWRDNSDLTITATDAGNGVMEVTASSATAEGNALVYIKDGSDNILWSWHIWVTNYDPATDNESYGGYTFMNRNLGAVNNTAGDVGALGLLYQWGRKDPFGGASAIGVTTSTYKALYSDGSGNVDYSSTITETPSTFTNNLRIAVRNPGVFYKMIPGSFADWYTDNPDKINGALWGATKTVYDPCPLGWKVAPAQAFSLWSTTTTSWDDTNKGRVYTDVAGSWYPAAGARSAEEGALTGVGDTGFYWFSDALGGNITFTSPSVSDVSNARSCGFSVRCVQEN